MSDLPLDTIVCSDALAFLKTLPDASVDCEITSPPYDNLRKYGGDKFSFDDFAAIACELYRVLKDGGVCVWVVADATVKGSETLTSFRQALHFKDIVGFNVSDTMIYQKNGSSPNIHHPRYLHSFEYMFVLVKGITPKHANLLTRPNKLAGKKREPRKKMQRDGLARKWGASHEYQETSIMGNVWSFNTGAASGDDPLAFKHPAPFPEKLAEQHILTWTISNEVVLDPFMGSGTTALVARRLGRHYIGCDLNPEYVALANKRLSDSDPYQPTVYEDGSKQLSLFGDL